MPEALIGWSFRGSRKVGGYLMGDGVFRTGRLLMKPHPNKNFCISNFNSVPWKAWGGDGAEG